MENTHAHTYRIIRKVKTVNRTGNEAYEMPRGVECTVYEVKAFRWFRDEMTRYKKVFNHGGLQMGIVDWDYHYHERIQYFTVASSTELKEGQEGEFGDGVLIYPYVDNDLHWSEWTPCPEKGIIIGGSRTFIQTHGINEEDVLVDRLTKHDIDAMIEVLKNLRVHETGEEEE